MGCFISLFKSPEQDDTVSKARKQTKRTKEPEKRDKSTQQNAKGKKPESNAKDAPILIAVVGRTGSGLSQFIHDVTGSYKHGVAPAASLQRHTNRIQEVTALIKEPYFRKHITLIDTPGFDYSRNNDERATFKQLAKWLRKRYGSNAKLDGVIYMHNIWNEELYHRSPFYTSDPLEQLCGRDWRKKVILVNSHWDEGIGDDGMEREDRLRSGYWSFMSYRGSPMVRYESPGDRIRAREILKYVI